MEGLMISKKMATQLLLLLSLSISTLVFSYSFLFSSPFLFYSQKLNYYLNYLNNLQILSRAANKNCIFLICNTLFFLVAKTSGSATRSPPDSGPGLPNDFMPPETSNDVVGAEQEPVPVFEKDIIVNESQAKEIEKVEEENNSNIQENDGRKELEGSSQVSIFIAESDDEGDQEEKGEEVIENDECGSTESCCFIYDDEEEEENDDDDNDDVLSREEWNQKFEDFIRRMKEEIRLSEPRKQLLLLN